MNRVRLPSKIAVAGWTNSFHIFFAFPGEKINLKSQVTDMATAQMAKKKLFTADYEVHASIKMLYPYIQSASGLSEWFADDVKINNESKVFTFFWDNEQRKAKQIAHRTNHFAKFEFVPESEDDEKDPSYFELRLEFNELTQSVFLKVFDYSDFEDMKELHDLWNGLVDNLRKTVGG